MQKSCTQVKVLEPSAGVQYSGYCSPTGRLLSSSPVHVSLHQTHSSTRLVTKKLSNIGNSDQDEERETILTENSQAQDLRVIKNVRNHLMNQDTINGIMHSRSDGRGEYEIWHLLDRALRNSSIELGIPGVNENYHPDQSAQIGRTPRCEQLETTHPQSTLSPAVAGPLHITNSSPASHSTDFMNSVPVVDNSNFDQYSPFEGPFIGPSYTYHYDGSMGPSHHAIPNTVVAAGSYYPANSISNAFNDNAIFPDYDPLKSGAWKGRGGCVSHGPPVPPLATTLDYQASAHARTHDHAELTGRQNFPSINGMQPIPRLSTVQTLSRSQHQQQLRQITRKPANITQQNRADSGQGSLISSTGYGDNGNAHQGDESHGSRIRGWTQGS